MAGFMDRMKASYSVLTNRASLSTVPPGDQLTSMAPSSLQARVSYDNQKAVLAPIMTRIAVDVAAVNIKHVVINENEQYKETKYGELNDRLTIRANTDQTGRDLIRDAVMTMLQTGAVAMIPVETDKDPIGGTYDILSLRAGAVVQWYNKTVEVEVYNEWSGQKQNIVLPKYMVAIAYNPMYSVMNEPNSTLRRLIDRLALLDTADGKLFSPQLDLIVQLPFVIKNERLQEIAAQRLTQLEEQLYNRKYGVAYVGATEKIHQLNRPVTNDLVQQVVGLTNSLHSQLGLTPNIFSGSATQEELNLYNNRTVFPIVQGLCDALTSTFLTRTAIKQGQRVIGFPDRFKMAPLSEFSQAADSLTRNEVMTSNEVRAIIGLPPAADEDADKLRNKNLNKPMEPPPQQMPQDGGVQPDGSPVAQDPLNEATSFEEFKELI